MLNPHDIAMAEAMDTLKTDDFGDVGVSLFRVCAHRTLAQMEANS